MLLISPLMHMTPVSRLLPSKHHHSTFPFLGHGANKWCFSRDAAYMGLTLYWGQLALNLGWTHLFFVYKQVRRLGPFFPFHVRLR